jgi:hypothetical protein
MFFLTTRPTRQDEEDIIRAQTHPERRRDILKNNIRFILKKLKSKPGVCLAQRRKVRKEKQRRMLATCFNNSKEKFLDQVLVCLCDLRRTVLLRFILSLRLCVSARKWIFIMELHHSGVYPAL